MNLSTQEFGERGAEYLSNIVKGLVDQPEKVSIEPNVGGSTVVFFLKVGKGEAGKVIGKRGRTAEALRTLLMAHATKCNSRAILEIED
jgi:hypothetical protein